MRSPLLVLLALLAVSSTARADGGTLTALFSTKRIEDFCDGGRRVDSGGYRRTLTRERAVKVRPNATQRQMISAMLKAVTTSGQCEQLIDSMKLEVRERVLHIPQIDGWAGISVMMCSCRPEVEVNLVRVPGIDSLVWD